jgi:hypothetical protein
LKATEIKVEREAAAGAAGGDEDAELTEEEIEELTEEVRRWYPSCGSTHAVF